MDHEDIWSVGDHIEISVEDPEDVFVREMLGMVSKWEFSTSNECCIYRVPENIRCVNESAYVPRMVSIGPYHHENQRLHSTQGFKMMYCKALLIRSRKTFRDILELLAAHESRARCFYEKSVEMSSKEFLGMILADSCFIIEYLLRLHYPKFKQQQIGDELPHWSLIQNHIKHDLILLENQLPFFILEILFHEIDPLFEFTDVEKSGTQSLSKLVMCFFAEYIQIGIRIPDDVFDIPVKHFTDLIRSLHIPKLFITQTPSKQTSDHSDLNRSLYITELLITQTPLKRSSKHSEFIANATQLYQSGVIFKASDGKCLLEIDFKSQHLNLTPIEISEEKESLYRNILAFEACHYPKQPFIADYFAFMDTLIDDSYDVTLLVQSGVLVNRLGDNWSAADTFNRFCTGITHRSATSYLRPVCDKLNLHYKKPQNTWMTSFKHNYFGTPITAACSILAFLVTVFTFISSVCSIISVIQG